MINFGFESHLVSNFLQADGNSSSFVGGFAGNSLRVVGGNIMGHACTYRIFLKKMGHDRIAIMYDSPYHAYDQVRFTISENGIEDSVEEKRAAEAIESSNESGW
jgi:hypothetical protein